MTLKSFLLLFFLSVTLNLFGQDQTIKITDSVNDLKDLISVLESKHQLLISYKESDVQNIPIRLPKKALSLTKFLEQTLQNTPLSFEILDQNYILLKNKGDQTTTLLCGTVYDGIENEPLEFANIYILNSQTGTLTESNGKFKLETIFAKTDTLVISYLGYEEQKIAFGDLDLNKCLDVVLQMQEFSSDFVLVTDYINDGIRVEKNGVATVLTTDKMGILPGQVEPDVLQSIHFLPGISSADGSVESIHIRGGTPDQNLILWESIPIYHSAHYFGMISSFNSNIINDAKVFRGGFDVDYGGRISGVIDLKSPDTEIRKTEFGFGSNLLNVFADGKIRLKENKSTVVFSMRRSLSNGWRSPTFESISRRNNQSVLLDIPVNEELPTFIKIENDFTFFDANLKGSFQLTDKDKVNLAFFYNKNIFNSSVQDDNVRRVQLDSLDLDNQGFSIAYERLWNKNIQTKIVALSTDYQYVYGYRVNSEGRMEPDNFGNKGSNITERQIQVANHFKLKNENGLKLGYQLSNYDVSHVITSGFSQNTETDNKRATIANVQTIYSSFNTSNERNFGLEAGVRVNHFDKEKQFYAEPRLRLWYNTKSNFSFSLTAGKYYQFLSQLIQLQGDRSSIDLPVWVMAGDQDVPVLDALQLQLGGIYRYKTLLIDLQFYTKQINGLTSLSTGFDEDLGGKYHLGKADIKGIDLLVKNRWNRYTSWVSYSFSNINHEFETFFDSNFAGPNDRPHSINWVNSWNKKPWTFSLGWKVKSGTPFSNIQNFRVIQNSMGMDDTQSIQPTSKQFNDLRLGVQHQLDASLSYTLLPKNDKDWKAEFGLSILNVYDRVNTYNRSFFIDRFMQSVPRLIYLDKSELGFTPNLSIRFEW